MCLNVSSSKASPNERPGLVIESSSVGSVYMLSFCYSSLNALVIFYSEGFPIIDIDQGEGGHKDEHFSGEVQRNHNRALYLHSYVRMIEIDRKGEYMHRDDTEGGYCTQGV